jgi:hypothetical protein
MLTLTFSFLPLFSECAESEIGGKRMSEEEKVIGREI